MPKSKKPKKSSPAEPLIAKIEPPQRKWTKIVELDGYQILYKIEHTDDAGWYLRQSVLLNVGSVAMDFGYGDGVDAEDKAYEGLELAEECAKGFLTYIRTNLKDTFVNSDTP